MTDERTEYQTADGQSTSQELSMRATTPPAEVPGYRLSGFLGSGAFGQVWVGRDLNTGRSVAVKFYLHRGGVNWSLLSREVKNLVQLSADRQVVQVLEVGWDADPPYYVMELVTGGSLEDLLQIRDRMPVNEAVDMFRRICVGLNHCHAKGVLHCDIKPANILLGDDGEPRLADFGQSRLSNEQTPSLGTLFYMAPEQADLNSTPDASWDVYAVGAILYRMLTGSPPYRDETIVEQIDTAGSLPKRLRRYREAITRSPSPSKHLQTSGVDRPLAKIVSRCLAATPDQRYENVQQILQDLSRRDASRSRRPLMLLGIVGPLLIFLAMSFFGYRSIKQASLQTVDALRTEAFGSNKLAATFAARTLESEIERYYDLARDEAENEPFASQLRATLMDGDIKQLLQEIASMGTPAETHQANPIREQLLDHPERMKLDQILVERLNRYTGPDDSSRRPRLSTMYVTDAYGTIIGIAYTEQVERDKNSAGRNFAYRTYYHGGRTDLPKDEVKIGEIPPLRRTHLSSAFPSTATGIWKVAVSLPIYFDDESSAQGNPDAIFVATINLGDFELLQSEQGANQVAVLVEARPGLHRGTILQHPLMDLRRAEGTEIQGARYQIQSELMDELLEGGDVDFLDPLASAVDGTEYDGPWIAAMQPVALPQTQRVADDQEIAPKDNSAKTDLLVLVQYRLKTVLAPVTAMRNKLVLEGLAALASILIVTVVLWYFVLRADSPRRNATKPTAKKTAEPTETLAAEP